MKKKITVTVDLCCSEAQPATVQSYLDNIIHCIKEKALSYRSDPDYHVINIAWDEPRKADLTIDVEIE